MNDDKITKTLWDIARAPGFHRVKPETAACLDLFIEQCSEGGFRLRPEIQRVETYARYLAKLNRERGCEPDHPQDDRRVLEAQFNSTVTDQAVEAFRRLYRYAWRARAELCPDDAVCHRRCEPQACARVRSGTYVPLSHTKWKRWPDEVVVEHGGRKLEGAAEAGGSAATETSVPKKAVVILMRLADYLTTGRMCDALEEVNRGELVARALARSVECQSVAPEDRERVATMLETLAQELRGPASERTTSTTAPVVLPSGARWVTPAELWERSRHPDTVEHAAIEYEGREFSLFEGMVTAHEQHPFTEEAVPIQHFSESDVACMRALFQGPPKGAEGGTPPCGPGKCKS